MRLSSQQVCLGPTYSSPLTGTAHCPEGAGSAAQTKGMMMLMSLGYAVDAHETRICCCCSWDWETHKKRN